MCTAVYTTKSAAVRPNGSCCEDYCTAMHAAIYTAIYAAMTAAVRPDVNPAMKQRFCCCQEYCYKCCHL